MEKPTVKIDFSQIIFNIHGKPVKDMIDAEPDLKREDAPDLTYGALISNALLLSKNNDKKLLFKHFQLSQEIEQSLKNNDGIVEWNLDEINDLNQAWAKMDNPNFNIPLYAGAIQQLIEEKKAEVVMIEKKQREKAKEKPPETKS